jgi:hypothetical protein
MKRGHCLLPVAMIAALLALCAGASAQPPRAPDPRPKAESEGPALKPGDHTDDGVIKPRGDVDPEMTIRPPDAGRTPVIPPPGTPGGDPNVVPK